MRLNYRKVGVSVFTKIADLASASVVWRGCVSRHGLDRRPQSLCPLVIFHDLASTPLIIEAGLDWGPRVGGLMWAAELELPAINPGAEVTPESAEFRLCLFPLWRRVSHPRAEP